MKPKKFTREEIKMLREKYPAGTRIKLTEDMDDMQPVKKGELGTVTGVDDVGTIHMRWDTGSGLGIIEGCDHFVIVQEKPTDATVIARNIDLLKAEILRLQSTATSGIKAELDATGDLDSVKRIKGAPSVFTVPFSEIAKSPGHILSASYYDLPGQSIAIMEKITQLEEKYGAEAYDKIGKLIDTLCEKGTIETSKEGKIRLHEKVVETLRSIKEKYYSAK